MNSGAIQVRRDGAFAEVILANPGKRNALSSDVIRELVEAFEEVGRGDARGAILGATGPVFCAGHDYEDMIGRDLGGMQSLLLECTRLMRTIQGIPQPVVARVQGLATGAGCQMA